MPITYFTPQQENSSKPPTDATATGFDVDRGTSSAPQSKFRLFLSSLLRLCRQSTLRLLALEIRYFPLHIQAIVDDSFVRFGNTFQCGQWDNCTGSCDEEHKYSRVCRYRTQELQASHRWVGPIDLDLALYMHRKGALWALHTYGIGRRSTEQIQPSKNPQRWDKGDYMELRTLQNATEHFLETGNAIKGRTTKIR
jgi:hypothetical protein